MVILFGLAVVPQHTHFLRHGLAVRGGRAAFPARAQILSGIKAECGRLADRAGLEPAVLLLREIFGAMGLAGIFHNDQAIALRQFNDRVHIRDLTVKVHGNDRGDRSLEFPVNKLPECPDQSRTWSPDRPGACRIHAVRPRVDIHKIDARSGLSDRLGGGDEGMRNGHDYVARLNPRGHQSEPHRVGAARQPDAIFRFAKLGKVPLESLDHGSANEACRAQHRLENRNQLRLEFRVHRDQVKKGDLALRVSHILSISPP